MNRSHGMVRVPPSVWAFAVSGYRVLPRWLAKLRRAFQTEMDRLAAA